MCIARLLFLGLLSLIGSKRKTFVEESHRLVKMENNGTMIGGFYSQLVENLPLLSGLILSLFLASLVILVVLISLTVKLATKAQNQQADTSAGVASNAAEQSRPALEDQAENQTRHRRPTEAVLHTPIRPSAPYPTTSTPFYPEHNPRPQTPALSPLNPFRPGATHQTYEPATSNLNPFLQSQPPEHNAGQETSSYRPDLSSFSRRKERVPESFNGAKVELKDWLFTFDVLARLNGWTEEEKGSQLTSLLRGNALQVLEDLPVEDREDYETVVESLKRRFDPEEKKGLKKMEFKNRTKRRNESVTEYGYALSKMTKGAYPKLDYIDREELAIDQFVDGLPNLEIQKHVQFGRPTSLNQAIALATEFETFESRKEGRKPEPSKPVRAVGRKEEDDTKLLLKNIAEGQKQLVNFISSQDSGHRQTRTYPKGCHNCGSTSHWVRDCPKPRMPRGPQHQQQYNNQQYRQQRMPFHHQQSNFGNQQMPSYGSQQPSFNNGYQQGNLNNQAQPTLPTIQESRLAPTGPLHPAPSTSTVQEN